MKESIRILIADHHEIYREGLKATLEEIPGLELSGEAANGLELLHLPELKSTDVVLLDMRLPLMDGLEASVILRRRHPELFIIGLVDEPSGLGTNDDHIVHRYLQKGAGGTEWKAILENALEVVKHKKSINNTWEYQAVRNPKNQVS